MSIRIKNCDKPKFYQDANIIVLNIEITNRCIFAKQDLRISICPPDSGSIEKSFEQRMQAKDDSFIAADIPVNPVDNNFISPFALKRGQLIKGNVIIALKEGCWCNSIQIVTSKGKVLSELAINKNDVVIKPFIIEEKL